MKAFAGGNLLDQRREALSFVTSLEGIDVVAVGMVSAKELLVNIALLHDSEIDDELWEETSRNSKRVFIASFLCKGCGTCIEYCPNEALYLEDGVCKIKTDRCILCGYCAPRCPEFAIRMV
jgi:NAD-dependent dihydropyrimidine dehydrogenase PreA subunit